LLNLRRFCKKDRLNFCAPENRFNLLSSTKCQLMTALNRRDWLRNSTLAAIGIGIGTRGFANETCIPKNFAGVSGWLNLGSNENPYGMSPKAKEAVRQMLSEAHRYRFNIASLDNFSDQIGKHYQAGGNQVLITAGSGEALNLLARHFSKGNLVTATPTFAAMPKTAKKIGTKVIEIPLTAEKIHDLPAMLRAIDSQTQTVYICNPANPTSTVLPSAELKNFCLEASRKATVIIDEAYIDFPLSDNESMISLTEKNPNIIVVRTFSKIHAMAGMRIGFIAAHPSVIDTLDRNYFSNAQMCVGNLTLAAALASLGDEAHRVNCRQKNEAAKNYTVNALKEMGIRCVPSATNFLFFPLGKYPGDFASDMLKENTIVRSYTNANGKWARVSIGTMEEMQRFIPLMKKFVK
jgi:histidinol-phosphate aminotransferase